MKNVLMTEHDQPLFNKIYKDGVKDRIKIDFNNYQKQPEHWTRRFGNGK